MTMEIGSLWIERNYELVSSGTSIYKMCAQSEDWLWNMTVNNTQAKKEYREEESPTVVIAGS